MSKKIMNKSLIVVATSFLIALSATAAADVSSTVNLASDYTFNGISQTGNDPALQASLDYSAESGFYVGTWASNVDFGGDTNIEWDAYLGQYFQLNKEVSLDVGIAYYTYNGGSTSEAPDYPEVYTKFGYNSSLGNSELNFWYSWDYFGSGAGHYITMVAHTFEVTPGHSVKVSFDRSTSTDKAKWAWDAAGNDTYNHYRVEYMTSWKGFDFDLALEDTSLDIDTADARVVLSVSRTFSL
jgi:uncharacterized protein (TIGR02001 family)